MPVNISEIRNLLMPGLISISGNYVDMPSMWTEAFEEGAELVPEIASVSLPVAVAMGAAAVLINNPEVTRRSLFNRILDI